MRRSCGDPGEILAKKSLRDLVQVLVKRFAEILVKSLLGGPCIKILEMLCVRGACMEVFLGCS